MVTQSIQCKYFTKLPARWHCSKCNVNMANECAKVTVPSRPDADKLCPICSSPLKSLGIGNSIKPFWERIPKFFSYPAKVNNLIYITLLSLAVLASLFLPVLDIGIQILAFFALLNYASKCLFRSAQGKLTPPGVLEVQSNNESIAVSLCAISVFSFAVVTFSTGVNQYLGLAVTAFSLLSIPAITMLLAMTGRFFEGINPLKVIGIMSNMGKSYLLLYLFLILMAGSSELIKYWASDIVNEFFLAPFLFFINAYFLVSMFAMMGYAIYQYHEAFGFDGVAEADLVKEGVDLKTIGVSPDTFLNEIHILLSEGLYEEAGKRLRQKIKDVPANLAYREKYHNLLKLTKDAAGMAEHTEDYMRILLGQPKANKGQAIMLYHDCLKFNPDFHRPDPILTVSDNLTTW